MPNVVAVILASFSMLEAEIDMLHLKLKPPLQLALIHLNVWKVGAACPCTFVASHVTLLYVQVFTAAAADERKNIVLLAFETMEKIVREYFPYITETETTTFTDCVRCLITFTNSRFNSDVSFNAIAFLRFCAVKLADGGLVCNERSEEGDPSTPQIDKDASDGQLFTDRDDHASYWIPLLTGNLLKISPGNCRIGFQKKYIFMLQTSIFFIVHI